MEFCFHHHSSTKLPRANENVCGHLRASGNDCEWTEEGNGILVNQLADEWWMRSRRLRCWLWRDKGEKWCGLQGGKVLEVERTVLLDKMPSCWRLPSTYNHVLVVKQVQEETNSESSFLLPLLRDLESSSWDWTWCFLSILSFILDLPFSVIPFPKEKLSFPGTSILTLSWFSPNKILNIYHIW